MKKKNLTSTPIQLKTLGGEMRTWIPEGAITGAAIGAVLGIIIGFTVELSFKNSFISVGQAVLASAPSGLIFTLILIVSSFSFGFAGALVGIGIPKFNPNPQQGKIKHWKTLIFKSPKSKTIYVPEQTRDLSPNQNKNLKS